MEPSIKINRCLEPDEYCSRNASAECAVRRFYQAMQKEVEERWASLSLADILKTYGRSAECGCVEMIGEIQRICRKEIQNTGIRQRKGEKNRGEHSIRRAERNCSLY